LLLTALGHLFVDFFPYPISFFVVLFVYAASKKPNLVIGVLIPLIIVLVVVFGLGQTKLGGPLCDSGLDLILAGTFAGRAKI
jgi:hypothetical protein